MSPAAPQQSGLWKYWRIDAAGLCVCAAMTVGIYVIGVRALLHHVEQTRSHRRELADLHQREEQLSASIATLRSQLTTVRGEIDKLPLNLESAQQINQRIARLTDLAGETGLEIHDIQPNAPVSKPRFAIIPITLSGMGDYRSCATFLRDLRQVFPDSGVATFDLRGNPADPKSPAVFTFGIIWHVEPLRAPNSSAAADKAVAGVTE